ncbi:TetR/AcrR family transcriptional regulator [Ramlibacter sp. H39-3-26]|uniref:TetR/AcrR family transcriptional regulator n=1 Tax=Curvibacter soli TaxID=3031331 RepID=UPI0023DCCBD0|nr:TetR/AcrR family transcriptional regulator [Ramlibacter sp. H39-3-26]MDF1486417.1 TetR/AcrR family transcriptional regulator [Ramlibacter sp. H39-3-26]
MAKKAPRRTAERILETALDLFNRFGEPHVSTTLISAEMRISPGNLYYHYPSKEALINALAVRYGEALGRHLSRAPEVEGMEQASAFVHALCGLVWDYRFLYRNLADLLAGSRRLEAQVQAALAHKDAAMRTVLGNLARTGAVRMQERDIPPTAAAMVMVLTYWLSFEFVLDPRSALEAHAAPQAVQHGTQQVLHLLAPYLAPAARAGLPREFERAAA